MASLIFLAGGRGSRMGNSLPKQYLDLNNQKIFLYSLKVFQKCPLIEEIVVVCEPEYEPLFPNISLFAEPGKRRQDSVYHGLLKTTKEIVLTHDSARPFVEEKALYDLMDAIERTGAGALGTPVTSTIKETDVNRVVKKTLNRSNLFDMQTPQGMKRGLFFKSFEFIHKNGIDVTDDLSMCELIGAPSEIVPSSPNNFKITTPFDLRVAETMLLHALQTHD